MITEPSPWRGRVDSEDGEAGRRWHQVVEMAPQHPLPGPANALLGLASDRGVRLNKGRPGAAGGPRALRAALANMAWHHELPLFDAGDIPVDDDLATGQSAYAARAAQHLDAGHFVVGLGGGHEIGWASYQGCRRHLDGAGAGQRLGIVNFDAHFDLRLPAPDPSSGTPFYQAARDCENRGQPFDYFCLGVAPTANTAALYRRAEQLGAHYLGDLDCRGECATRPLERFLAQLDALYVTICLDVFPPAHAPGVSAPAAPGVDPGWVLRTLSQIGRLCRRLDVRWLMADVAELSPPLDPDGRTARLGARLVDACLAARRG
ncbi:formimidoylglutamase [Parahaliea mediterranea]|uniref:Formimidoylglutamase n=1 Tax=Parahaliea mediterranea TaxID=651086 RepID=A0A939DD62_9GAMM|nr:formimidoylglutamase [Parahaliea mediterranea]MBN7795981.1 formimidoylglutamase [Parahaliea mediterranea]